MEVRGTERTVVTRELNVTINPKEVVDNIYRKFKPKGLASSTRVCN